MRRLTASVALAVGLAAGCGGSSPIPGPKGPPARQTCVDEARPDGSCLPPSQATIDGWLELGVSREAVQDCLRLHPDGDQALAECVYLYAVRSGP